MHDFVSISLWNSVCPLTSLQSSLLLHIYSQRKPETKSSLEDKTQKNTHTFLRPKKIHDRSLDPKKYWACKFSTQKIETSQPPRPPYMYTSSTPPGDVIFICLFAYSVSFQFLKRDEICNQSIPIDINYYVSIVIENRYQSITTRIFAIDWSSIININRLIDIDWYRLISIVIDYRFHRLDTPGLKRVSKQISCRRRTQKQTVLSVHNRPCTKRMALTLFSVLLILRFFSI